MTVWDAETGAPLGPVVSWQCRRSAPACAGTDRGKGHAPRVQALTGAAHRPDVPGPKMRWLMDRAPGRVRLGTIDAWLIHCLTDRRGPCLRCRQRRAQPASWT